MGFNKNQVAQFQKLANNPDAVQKAIDDAKKITAEQVALAKIELGELLANLPKATNGGANQYGAKSTVVSNEQKPKSETIAELGFTQKQAERAALALKIKPVIAKLAKEQQIRKPAESVLQKSAEQKPIDTRQEIAKAAGVSHDTIAKVEKIEQQAAPEIKAARAEKILRVRL